ncbi:MAG: DGQHR domain-containing protein [Polyangiaceae bacterium]|nr:DGQHR domain-containing protein [Polyangiaceae bacterium]MCW5788789.1 DGQHR domain-containing protein [Polyangiaceae bacterium]
MAPRLFPALKVQQSSQTIYLVNLVAQDVERLVRFEVLGDESAPKRRASSRKASLVNWADIEGRIEEKDEAYQRPILKKKLGEIADYVLGVLESGQLPPLPGAVLLTTDEPVAFHAEGMSPFVGNLVMDDDEPSLRVLDGQHRLLAMCALLASTQLDEATKAKVRDLQIPAVLFVGLSPAAIVEMFVTINSKHTRLNPSLLLSLSGRQLFRDERDAEVHDIIRTLNEDAASALRGEIKMLGVGSGRIAQAGIAQELRRTVEATRKDAAEAGWLSQYEQGVAGLYNEYFQIAQDVFQGGWGQPGYSTHSALALRALIQASHEVLRRVFAQLQGGQAPREAMAALMEPWRSQIGAVRFETAGRWRERAGGGGKETTRLLARELVEALAAEGGPADE